MADEMVLVLQGGGALGAYEAGVYKALEEHRIIPDVIAGVSIGAVNAALIAGQPKGKAAPVLEDFWLKVAIPTPPAFSQAQRRLASAWQALWWGVPTLFLPRWSLPLGSAPVGQWTSFYVTSPMKATLEKFVDFSRLGSNGTRLLLTTVNLETGELEVFDSAAQSLGPEHILASGSLPPGLPWTQIDGKYYWDGALVSNTPLRPALERLMTECVLDNRPVNKKRVFMVDLFPKNGRLPHTLMDVMERQKEILYSDKTEGDAQFCGLSNDVLLLIQELLGHLDEATKTKIRRSERYRRIQCHNCPVEVTRIVHLDEPDEFESKDYDFSKEAIEHHLALGYRNAIETLR